MSSNILHPEYTSTGGVYQLVLPIDVGRLIPEDDSVRLLNAVIERMDFSKLLAAYSRLGRIERSPKSQFKVLVYGYMNFIYSSRKLEQACRRDVNFMCLLGGEPVPDHTTIARFRSERLAEVIEDLFWQLVKLLEEAGELSLLSVFIDGSKLEANANRYSFVWKKSTPKNEAKMQEKMKTELPKFTAEFDLRFRVGEKIKAKHLKKLRKQLYALKGDTEFVHGKGKRKSLLQRAIEAVEEYLARQKKYDDYNHTFGDRNSFSKSDKCATFMRLKEDHMRNGQLKPAYNVALAVDAEYIVAARIFQERNDTNTFIPMMEELLPLGYTQPVADSGYESEENYTWCENNGQLAFIKPANHERAKTRKYKSDIGRRENLPYDPESDSYICHADHKIQAVEEKKSKSKTGYPITTTIYSCANCAGCESKPRCIKGRSNKPLEERSKNLYVPRPPKTAGRDGGPHQQRRRHSVAQESLHPG